MTADDGERLLTNSDAAAVLGVDDTTVKRWAPTGKLTSVVTPGGHRRFRPGDVERLTGDRGRVVEAGKRVGRGRLEALAPLMGVDHGPTRFGQAL